MAAIIVLSIIFIFIYFYVSLFFRILFSIFKIELELAEFLLVALSFSVSVLVSAAFFTVAKHL